MNKDLEVYFNNYFEMFRSEGWKQLLKDFQQNVVNINSVEQTTDADNLHFRKGQLAILATIVNLENQMDNAHKNALEEEEKSSEEEEALAEETNE
tara:strand:- start:1405 stop:1689 length:285 start_codon:yes stop_codon:yes gene_type:complete